MARLNRRLREDRLFNTPNEFTVWLMNRFGDLFLIPPVDQPKFEMPR
jgi:hypothetical protein